LFDEIANWAPFVAYGAIAVISIVLYFFAKKKSPEARNYTILTTAIGVIELVTDSLFIYDTYQLTSKSLFIASFGFHWTASHRQLDHCLFRSQTRIVHESLILFSLSFKGNFHQQPLIFSNRGTGKGDWLLKYSLVSSLAVLVSVSNVEVLSLLDSRIFNLEAFSMGWSNKTHLQIRTMGLIGNIVDNVPQLIIQGFYLGIHGVSGVAIAALVASSTALLFGVIKRLLVLFILRFDPAHSKQTPEVDMKEVEEL